MIHYTDIDALENTLIRRYVDVTLPSVSGEAHDGHIVMPKGLSLGMQCDIIDAYITLALAENTLIMSTTVPMPAVDSAMGRLLLYGTTYATPKQWKRATHRMGRLYH